MRTSHKLVALIGVLTTLTLAFPTEPTASDQIVSNHTTLSIRNSNPKKVCRVFWQFDTDVIRYYLARDTCQTTDKLIRHAQIKKGCECSFFE